MKPNIILVVMDTVRADNLPMWGYHKKTTPFLDEFSKTAVTYKQAISNSPWTLPSHVSLFSGLHPSEHGVLTSNQRAGNDLPLIADALKAKGYQTAGFTSNPWASSLYSLDRGFDVFIDVYKKLRKDKENVLEKNLRCVERLFCMHDGGAELTNNYVKQWLNSTNSNNKPFFIFINYMDAHSPYLPKKPLPQNLSPKSVSKVIKSWKLVNNMGKICVGSMKVSKEELKSCIDLYDDAIRYLDFKISQLVEFLKNKSMFNNTMIIITSDHGENFGEHKSPHTGPLMLHYFCLYDTLLHVPLIIKFPKKENEGKKINSQIQLSEVPFMIANTAGIDFPVSSGRAIHNRFDDMKPGYGNDFERLAFSEYITDPLHLGEIRKEAPELVDKFKIDLKSVRTNSHKLIISSKAEPVLYDLLGDPNETKDIAAEQPEHVKKLKTKLENRVKQQANRYSVNKSTLSENKTIKQRLAQLGYV